MKFKPIALLLPLLLAGCIDDDGPTAPAAERSVFSLLGGLEVGQSLRLSGEEAASVYLNGGAGGAEYVVIPFFASEAGRVRLQVEIAGTNVQGTTRAAASHGPSLAHSPLGAEEGPQLDWARHEQFHRQAIRDLAPKISLARARMGSGASFSRAGAAAPTLGSILPLNTSASCSALDVRHGRVEAISRTAIIVADTANPVAGLTAEDYRAYGEKFDALIHPVITRNFSEPTDIDENGRAIVFFTRAVNELTPPNARFYIGGFFWAGDLFPKSLCQGSNEAEIFYQLVADPEGEINNNRFPTEFVRSRTLGTLGHEYQHLINAGRRLYINDAEVWEESWLNEGLSHLAEELLFYEVSGLQPRRNLTLDDLTASQTVLDAINTYGVSNLLRYTIFLENPKEESLMGVDNLETRGAAWAFLRYAADQEEGDDATFFRSIVNSRFSGVENLSGVLGTDAVDLMQDWTASVYLDDRGGKKDERLQQPSWNFRSIVPVFYRDERFPLEVLSLGADEAVQLRLRGGGAAYVRVRGVAERQASVTTSSGGRIPPDRLRVTVVRTR